MVQVGVLRWWSCYGTLDGFNSFDDWVVFLVCTAALEVDGCLGFYTCDGYFVASVCNLGGRRCIGYLTGTLYEDVAWSDVFHKFDSHSITVAGELNRVFFWFGYEPVGNKHDGCKCK